MAKDYKVEHKVFKGDNITFNLTVNISGSDLYPTFIVKKYDKMTSIEYAPLRGFSIKVKERDISKSMQFDISDIYDFVDIFSLVYTGIKKNEDMFYLDNRNELLVNEKLQKKYTLYLEGKFEGSLIIRPNIVTVWAEDGYVNKEGIEFILNNTISGGMSHKTARKFYKLLNKTDWLNLCENIVGNTYRGSND